MSQNDQKLFCFSPADIERLRSICGDSADLSLSDLQLGKVTLNALDRAGAFEVRHLPRLWERTFAKGHDLGSVAPRVLQKLGEAFLLHTDRDGVIDWPNHWATRGLEMPAPKAEPPASLILAIAPDVPSRLSVTAARLAVGSALHLSARSINALEKAGMGTLGAFVEQAASTGIGKLRAVGKKSRAEIAEALHALPHSLDADGNWDHLAYSRRRDFPLLPEGVSPNSHWLETIAPVVSAAVRASLDDPAEFEIFARRYRIGGRPHMTLQEIGDALGLTRERVRQRQERVVRMISKALLADDYAESPFCFSAEFVAPLRATRQRIDDSTVRFWRASEAVLLIADSLQTDESTVRPVLELVMELLGWEVHAATSDRLEPVWVREGDESLRYVSQVADGIDRALLENPLGLDSYQLAARVNRRWPGQCSPDDVGEWARLCPTVEMTADGRFRCRFSCLRSNADKAYIVLLEAGSPLHFETITEEISRRQLDRGRDAPVNGVKAQLIADRRFAPIGKSGEWKLSAWNHIDGRSLVDIGYEALRKEDRPLHVDQIFDYVAERRPDVLRSSVASVLAVDSRFVRVGPATWASALWDDEKRALTDPAWRRVPGVDVDAVVTSFVRSSPTGTVPLREAVRHLVGLGLSEGCAYRRIGSASCFRISDAPGCRGKLVQLTEQS